MQRRRSVCHAQHSDSVDTQTHFAPQSIGRRGRRRPDLQQVPLPSVDGDVGTEGLDHMNGDGVRNARVWHAFWAWTNVVEAVEFDEGEQILTGRVPARPRCGPGGAGSVSAIAAGTTPVRGTACGHRASSGGCRLPLILASLTEILANRAVNLGQCRGRLSVPGSMMAAKIPSIVVAYRGGHAWRQGRSGCSGRSAVAREGRRLAVGSGGRRSVGRATLAGGSGAGGCAVPQPAGPSRTVLLAAYWRACALRIGPAGGRVDAPGLRRPGGLCRVSAGAAAFPPGRRHGRA